MRAGIGLHYLDLAHYQGAGGEFSPSSLFGDTDTGGFYDPSDLTSMREERIDQDNNNTSTEPSAGSVVGVILDKSQMSGMTAAAYIDSATNLHDDDFSTPGNWTLGTGWSIAANEATLDLGVGTGSLRYTSLIGAISAGDCYYVRFTVTSDTLSGAVLRADLGGTRANNLTLGVGTHEFVLIADGGSTNLLLQPTTTGTGTAVISEFVAKAIPGNHLVAPSDAARPILRDEIVDGTDVDVSASTELVTNGTFDDDTGWTEGGDWSISGGEASCTTAPSNLERNADSDFTGGAWHLISIEKTGGSTTGAGVSVSIGGFDTEDIITTGSQPAGTYKLLKRAEAVDPDLVRIAKGGSSEVIIDNVSVKEVPATASRRYYLEFDGTDDQMEASSVIGYNDGFTAVVGVATADNTNANQAVICERAAGSSNGFVVYLDTDDIEFWTGNGATWDIDSSLATLVDDTPVVFTAELTPTGQDKSLRDDGAAASATSGLTVAQSSLEQFRIGSATDAGSFHLEGRLYGTTLIDRVLTTTERQNLEIYLANKSGVTLDSSSTSTFPALLYDANTDGGLYDPSDLTSMRVETDGLGGAPSAGDTVGIIFDKSQMGGMTADAFIESQTEELADPNFDTPGDWNASGDWVVSGGQATITDPSGSFDLKDDNIVTVNGSWYVATAVISTNSLSGTNLLFRDIAGGSNHTIATGGSGLTGTFSLVYQATSTNSRVSLRPGAAGTGTVVVDSFSVKEIPGNHLVAPSDAARPVLRDEIVDGTDVDVSSATELLTNPDFSDGTTGWSQTANVSSFTESGGVATVVNGGAGFGAIYQAITLDPDLWYKATVVSGTASGGTQVVNATGNATHTGGPRFSTTVSASTTTDLLFQPSNTAESFGLQNPSASTTTLWESLSLKEVPASADRRYYLEFDGTDDQLEVSFGTSTWLTNTSYVTAFNPGSDTQYILHAEADNTDSAWSVAAQTGDASTTLFYDGSAFSADYFTANGGDSFTYTGGVTDRDDLYTAFLSGTHVITVRQDWTDYDGFGVSNYGPGGWYMDGNWYGTAIADRQLTYSEREELEAYLGRKSGTIDFDTAWHPSSLFENSEDGAVYDVSLASSLFQERTGASATTPAGVGDPVGTILDQSGNGNHAIAPSDAARPLLQRDSNGKLYLDYDGTDDELTASVTSNNDPWTLATAQTIISLGVGSSVYMASSPLTSRAVFYISSVQRFLVEDNDVITANIGLSSDPTDGAPHVNVGQAKTDDHAFWYDGNLINTDTSGDFAVTDTIDTIGFGHNTVANADDSDLYGGVFINRALTGTERDRLERWLADNAGINLKQ